VWDKLQLVWLGLPVYSQLPEYSELEEALAQRGCAAMTENQKSKGKNQKAKISDPGLGPGWGGISTV